MGKNDQAKAYNGADDVPNSAGGRARGAVTPSECFYCVEPCRNSFVINGGSASEADQLTALVDSFCIGKSEESEGYKNSRPGTSCNRPCTCHGEDRTSRTWI